MKYSNVLRRGIAEVVTGTISLPFACAYVSEISRSVGKYDPWDSHGNFEVGAIGLGTLLGVSALFVGINDLCKYGKNRLNMELDEKIASYI